MKFQESNEYLDVKLTVEMEGIISTYARFHSWADETFVFQLKTFDKIHFFEFYTDSILLKNMTVHELIDLDRIQHFRYCSFYKKDKYNVKYIKDIAFNAVDNANLN